MRCRCHPEQRSIIDGSDCNGTHTSGCGQTPPSVLVMAFPNFAGIGEYFIGFGSGLAIDSATDRVFVTVIGDCDVAETNGRLCRDSHTAPRMARVVPLRMGGWPQGAAVDESSGTVYVSNNTSGTVSLFSVKRHHHDDDKDDD